MAEAPDKRPKKEDSDGTSPELINSVNEDAAEREAVEEAAAQRTGDKSSTAAGDQNQSERTGTDSKSNNALGKHHSPSAGAATSSVERDMTDAEEVNDDSEPAPLQADSANGEIFPGVQCMTVARRCKKGDDDPAPLFLNRYGPRAKGWFVWSTTPALADGQRIEDLQNVSEKFHRVLDFPREQGKPRYRASNVHGILNIVWDCEGFHDNPAEAAELLNPEKVKRADELNTPKARRDWLQKKDHVLDKYPTTHMDVKFYQKINDDTRNPAAKVQGDLYTSWEVASQYKALYRKDQIKSEWRVYEAARQQAQRFTEWYARTLPEHFADHRRSLSRDPTVQPFKRSQDSASPGYDDVSSTKQELKREPSPSASKNVPQSKSKTTAESTPQNPNGEQDYSQKTTDRRQESETDDEKLTEEELRDAALQGWCAANKIAQPSRMSRKEQLKFNIYFDVYSKNLGY